MFFVSVSSVKAKMFAAVDQVKKKRRFFEFEISKLRENPDAALAETYIKCIPAPHSGKFEEPEDVHMFFVEHDFPGTNQNWN